MIKIMSGNILDQRTEALVNTVNCEGFMGKGIALQFKRAFPDNFEVYRRACAMGEVSIGRVFVFETKRVLADTCANPRYIFNFPTKYRWREKSQLEYIESGLYSLIEEVKKRNISSIAMPPLGCGLGGLRWRDVRPMIEAAFDAVPQTEAFLFEPGETPAADAMPNRTEPVKMTPARALLLCLMRRYLELGYQMTLLEIQKLAYFLQEAGENLRLNYTAHRYGPYAYNLNKVLEVTEGHLTIGYGDRPKPGAEIRILPGAVEKAREFVRECEDADEIIARQERVARLIEGFETPYGMEMLASVHWVAHRKNRSARNADDAVCLIHEWTPRKRDIFRPEHIRIAWERLRKNGWLPESAQ